MSDHPQDSGAQQRILQALKDARTRLEQAEARRTEPIAIIGLGCRFPGGVHDADSYWELLAKGVDAMAEVPGDRWDLDQYYDPDPDQPGKMYAREGGFIDDIGGFDPDFFRITRREAQSLDPQQRLLLEVVWNAFEDAGQSAERIRGSDTGFFMGLSWHDYERNVFGMNPDRLDAYAGMGNTPSIAAGRLAFVFGAHGPTMQVDTACSASLVAVHLACQSLRIGETRMAAAGGVNLMISPLSTVFCCKIKALSADSRCKTFDASADGYARGEGCGVVVLKRLSHALEDGDNIRAVIRGTAINHDGPASGLTVPNRRAQQRVIEAALANGRVDPLDVSYVEAHGTGTSLGDPIEIGALGDALGKDRPAHHPLQVGAVKTNFGHLEAAAGIAGLIKTVLSLEHGQIPPHLHFKEPSPEIDWDTYPISVPTELTSWDAQPRVGSVSSFGFSGTNAHVVLEEAPSVVEEAGAGTERPVQVLCLSTKTEEARRELAAAYGGYLRTSEADLGDICHTAHAGRAHFGERVAVVGESAEELAEKLTRYVEEGSSAGVTDGAAGRPKVGFLFTGQGSQWAGMGRELYENQPVFRAEMDRCAELLEGELERPLLEVMYGGEGELLVETAYTQPALFALEWSLAQMWRSWGLEPSVVMGHSVGEYVAACVAGVFSLEDGLRLISARGRLMQALPKDGSMVAVLAEESVALEALKGHEAEVSMAAVNGPTSVVISGSTHGVRAVVSALEAADVKCKALEVSHAFHSPLMDPMLDAFEEVAKSIDYVAPQLAMVSNVTGELVTDEVTRARYWRDHVRSPVRFADGMTALHDKGTDVYLEVGPSPVLVGMGRGCVPEETGSWLTSLRKGKPAWPQIQQTLAELYVQGVQVDWQGYDQGYQRRKVPLPTYPFQRQRFWVEPE
ncbi:MAG: type I polyketide synthase, partial [Longimicrobiales bacterium]